MFLNFWFSALNAKFKKGLIKCKYFFKRGHCCIFECPMEFGVIVNEYHFANKTAYTSRNGAF